VAIQFALLLALVFSPSLPALHPTMRVGWIFFAAGLVIFVAALAALGKAFTPNPMPNAHSRLVAHGIYRWIRHPMYTAVLVCAMGWALALGGIWHYIVIATLWAFFWLKSNLEEHWFTAQHADYANYRMRTGRFFPRLFRRP
jgi:protein-S-isoprenylcysteine O-methyltransferase Ste14